MPCVDLSGFIEENMWSFGSPLDPVRIKSIGDLDKEGWVSHNVGMGILSGTYIETGAHLFKGFPSIDSLPVDTFIVDALVVRVPKGPLERVNATELTTCLARRADEQAIIVDTGWHRRWGQPDFVGKSPHLAADAAELLAASRFTIIASDMVCFDPPDAPRMERLEKIFRSGALILSPLVNLTNVTADTVKLIALPLKLKGLNASPCRAVACW